LIYYAEFLLLGFISSGFSETTAAVQFALWLLVLIANIVSESKRQNLGLALLISSVLGATVVGILLLAISPSNISRLTAVSVKRPDFAIFIKQSFIFGLDFIRYSLHDKWLPFAVLFALSYGMSLLFPIQKSMHKKKVVMNVIIVILATYLISVVNSMPTMMIRSVFPENRAWFPTHYILVCSTFTIGYLVASYSSSLVNARTRVIVQFLLPVVLLLGISAYSIRMIPLSYSGTAELYARALAWDQRESLIIQEKKLAYLISKSLRLTAIDQITELQVDENNWVNVCAARYYGVME